MTVVKIDGDPYGTVKATAQASGLNPEGAEYGPFWFMCPVKIDHGRGIPAAFRKQLFERFSQADSSDGRSRGGTGLGMAIAKHLTEQMSGRISFDSEENVGTTFHLEFPLAKSDADAA